MNTALFDALLSYTAGSERASLLPIDKLVSEAEVDQGLRREAERHLVSALGKAQSPEAKEYICSKLALIGSEACVPAVARLLSELELSTAARHALEALPSSEAAKALRKSLDTLQGKLKVGVINSLGERRDEGSVSVLSKLLRDPDPETAQAAAWALGRIGTNKAGKALAKSQPGAVGKTPWVIADAALVCAEALAARGKREEAHALLRACDQPDLPKHLRQAIKVALA